MAFKRYNLSDTKIRQLANVFYIEQGNVTGVKACASHACNYLEKWQSKKYTNPYDCVLYSGWWSSEASVRERMNKNGASQAMIDGVRDVICNGNRTLPYYVDEYDWLHDIAYIINDGVKHTSAAEPSYVLNRRNYVKDKTIILNKFKGAIEYRFYCFPDGAGGINDPFGYISKPASSSEVIEVNEAHSGTATASGNSVSVIKEKAASFMEGIALDDSHGYSQEYREGPDFDCSSLLINAWEYAGVPVKKNGATYTGNMYAVFTRLGFKDVTEQVNLVTGAGMERSDVLLNHVHHTAMYCGNGKEVEASVNEKGTATGGVPGDQTGKEILIRNYRNFPWDAVLRYVGESGNVSLSDTLASSVIQNKVEIKLCEVEYGSCNSSVLALQKLLNIYGYVGRNSKELEEDGEFGANTLFALKEYQEAAGLNVDGVCGRNTWNKLKEGLTVHN